MAKFMEQGALQINFVCSGLTGGIPAIVVVDPDIRFNNRAVGAIPNLGRGGALGRPFVHKEHFVNAIMAGLGGVTLPAIS